MRTKNNNDLLHSKLIHLHGNDWLEKQRIAGHCVSSVMSLLQKLIVEKLILSPIELDKIAENEIIKQKCIPTFKGYKNFPNSICFSVNKQLVHGIPSSNLLNDGDIVSLDFGATYDGAIADSAITLIVGKEENKEHINLINAARECLYNAIKNIKVGLKTGIIGDTIFKTAKRYSCNVIEQYGGHGISWNRPHADIFISNKSNKDDGVIIQDGLTIAIEPLIVPGNCSTKTITGDDGWTVYTEDISAHTEHSIFIHTDRVEIITIREDENVPREIMF